MEEVRVIEFLDPLSPDFETLLLHPVYSQPERGSIVHFAPKTL
jgi:hypothetical protein